MPQKTRQQKIDASKRRQFRLIINDNPQPVRLSGEPLKQTVKTAEIDHVTSVNPYLLSDLRKSLMLMAFIFALEFFLYFVRIGNHIR